MTCNQIFSSALLNVLDGILAELPREDNLKRTIRNNRGYKNSPKPRCLTEIIVDGKLTFLKLFFKIFFKEDTCIFCLRSTSA